MRITLTDEQIQALDRQPDGVELEDPLTQRVYVLTDLERHRKVMPAL